MSNVELTGADRLAKNNLNRIWDIEKSKRGFTQESAAAIIAEKQGDKTNQATLGHYLNGRRRLTIKAVLMFSSFLNVKPEEIRSDFDYGYNEIPKEAQQRLDKDSSYEYHTMMRSEESDIIDELHPSSIRVPVYDIEASVGDGATNVFEDEISFFLAEKSDLDRHGVPHDHLKMIKIRGDSMLPELTTGDLVLVHHMPVAADKLHDGMFVILIDGLLFIKRLQRLPKKKIRVISTNKEAYEPFDIDVTDLTVIGRVVFAWRGKKF